MHTPTRCASGELSGETLDSGAGVRYGVHVPIRPNILDSLSRFSRDEIEAALAQLEREQETLAARRDALQALYRVAKNADTEEGAEDRRVTGVRLQLPPENPKRKQRPSRRLERFDFPDKSGVVFTVPDDAEFTKNRLAIVAAMATDANATWTPKSVHSALAARGAEMSDANVRVTLHRMAETSFIRRRPTGYQLVGVQVVEEF